jgi:pyruvate ferredoxin oxidoreductase alpha subunit
MPVVNRALSSPINIHCDHSDSMGTRDLSWVQIYSENAQEAYENVLLAIRVAEHPDVLLPVMVCHDGFITSHCVQNVRIHDDGEVRKFIGKRKSGYSLFDFKNTVKIGAIELQDYYFETKRQQQEAMKNALKVYADAGKELSKLTGNDHEYFEEYRTRDAEAVIVTMSSSAGTAKNVADRMRDDGKKVGVLKIRLFRPFPYEEVGKTLQGAKTVGVLERSFSFGANAPLFSEVRNSLFDLGEKPRMQSYVFGLGGRDLLEKDIEQAFRELLEGKTTREEKYLGLRE